ncbi:MAG TPA: ComEC/Rec2 family competence protein, partial [Halanaerobiales bacterium]|nr:ComEC/Rec2 family competence protein [Halanaerobiales bacterium]
HLEVYFLSVDQGDSIYIKTPLNQHILVDGGGYAGINYTQGELKLLPFFKYRGVKKLDLVVVTHFDADHALGVREVLKEREVSLLAVPTLNSDNNLAREIIDLAYQKDIPIIILREGDNFRFGDVNCQVLNPPDKSTIIDSNNNSIVLYLEYKEFSLLLTGDLEKEGEYRLLGQDNKVNSLILKLGHHGSAGSSSAAFLRRVSPLETVVSVGKNNYGHPSTNVLERIEEMGIRIWRTDEQGAIIVKSNGKSYTIKAYKNSL